MVSLFFLFALLASTSLSAPAQTIQEREPHSWSPTLADFHSALGKRIAQIRDLADGSPCDLSKASMPAAPTPLPGPGPGQVLRHVAIGRGTQVHSLLILHPFIQYSHQSELHMRLSLSLGSPGRYRRPRLLIQRVLYRGNLPRSVGHAPQLGSPKPTPTRQKPP